MKIASITDNDGVNSLTGFTLSIFTQGCEHACLNCYNKQTWNYNGGDWYDLENIKQLIINSKCKNVSLIGGDPFYPNNRNEIIELIKWIKETANKCVYVWTGYLKEDVEQWIDLSLIDILIDGKYEKDKHSLKLLLRGSSNQRLFYKGQHVTEKELLKIIDKD